MRAGAELQNQVKDFLVSAGLIKTLEQARMELDRWQLLALGSC